MAYARLFWTGVPTELALAFDAADEKQYQTALRRLEEDLRVEKELGTDFPGVTHSFRQFFAVFCRRRAYHLAVFQQLLGDPNNPESVVTGVSTPADLLRFKYRGPRVKWPLYQPLSLPRASYDDFLHYLRTGKQIQYRNMVGLGWERLLLSRPGPGKSLFWSHHMSTMKNANETGASKQRR